MNKLRILKPISQVAKSVSIRTYKSTPLALGGGDHDDGHGHAHPVKLFLIYIKIFNLIEI